MDLLDVNDILAIAIHIKNPAKKQYNPVLNKTPHVWAF